MIIENQVQVQVGTGLNFKLMYNPRQIRQRVAILAKEIESQFTEEDTPVIVPVLHGAMPFSIDLLRWLPAWFEIDSVQISSYDGGTKPGEIKVIKDFDDRLTGRNIIIVEDIVDSGRSVELLYGLAQAIEPASIRFCTLLQKQGAQKHQVDALIDWVGFCQKFGFLIGYGLDYDGRYRGLRGIYQLDE